MDGEEGVASELLDPGLLRSENINAVRVRDDREVLQVTELPRRVRFEARLELRASDTIEAPSTKPFRASSLTIKVALVTVLISDMRAEGYAQHPIGLVIPQ